MDLNARLASLDAALLRVTGRAETSKTHRPSAKEIRDVLGDLDVLLAAHAADLSAEEKRHLTRVRRIMVRQVPDYEPRRSMRQRLRGVWRYVEPKLRKAMAARSN